VDERASLGRIEPWLRAIALAIWAFPGISRFEGVQPWLAPWLAYGAAVALSTAHERLPRGLNVALLAVQTVSVLLLPRLGLVGFEGLLLSLVVVQVPLVLPLRAAVLWMLVQLPLALADVWSINTTRALFEISGAYSTFCAFALLIYWVRIQERKARAELAQSNASLLATRAMLVEGSRQAERLRISRELHDSLGHHLTALGLQLDVAQRQLPANDALSRARSVARESLSEVRKVVSTMQREEGVDLVPALKALASGIPAPKITIQGPDTLTLADSETSHALFRCVQEAITNSVKHASAKNVWVEIDRKAEGVQISVRDDGAGVSKVTHGNGLTGVSARIAQVGGSARFDSTPGQGFAVHLQLPMRA
jgi:signal transduction histidine kinase